MSFLHQHNGSIDADQVDPETGIQTQVDRTSPNTDPQPPPAKEYTVDGIGPLLIKLADVAPESVSWLWPDRLPTGKLVMLDGDPSLGKSTLALTLAAHVSTGRPWPDGATCPAGDVVVLSAEDGLADTIRPRLDAAGGNGERVHALTGVSAVDENGQRSHRPITLADTQAITETITRVRARLLIVDVLMAYMPGKVDSHRDQDVRTVLARLATLGERTGCCVLLLRHLNKAAGGSAVYRGGGSIGIIGAARAGYVVAPDPDDDSARVLACTKNNLAPTPPSLAYRLEPAPGSHVARVVWFGESTHRADELITPATEDPTERDDAAAFIADYLVREGGSALARDVQNAGRKAGYSKTTMHRAAARLGVHKTKDGMRGPWTWRHPDDAPGSLEGSDQGSERSSSQDPDSSEPSRGLERRRGRTAPGRQGRIRHQPLLRHRQRGDPGNPAGGLDRAGPAARRQDQHCVQYVMPHIRQGDA